MSAYNVCLNHNFYLIVRRIWVLNFYYDLIETTLGYMGVLASDKGLIKTTLPQTSTKNCISIMKVNSCKRITMSHDRFSALKHKLKEYFLTGASTFHNEPIDINDAPPFHLAAWKICRSIPNGQTRSYKWLASMAGNPKASRAAGQSMANNRLPIIIPCHRVISSNGKLGGFGKHHSMISIKRHLLEIERNFVT